VFATVVALIYVEENLRGKWAWNRYARDVEARGESLQLSAFVPPPVPDEQNLAMTPFLAPLFDFEPGTQQWRDTNAPRIASEMFPRFDRAAASISSTKTEPINSWVRAPVDLKAWYHAYRNPANPAASYGEFEFRDVGADQSDQQKDQASPEVTRETAAAYVLEAFEDEIDPVLDELRMASRRPQARFNIRYEHEEPPAILLPHLAVMKRLFQALNLRVAASLALGRPNEAHDDILLMFDLLEVSRIEPFLISHLVCVAEFNGFTLPAILAGLAGQQWNEGQLRELQGRLENLEFLRDGRRVLEAERAFGTVTLDRMRRIANRSELYRSWFDPNRPGESPGAFEWTVLPAIMEIAPGGWFHLEKVNYCSFMDDLLTSIDLENLRVRPGSVRRLETRIEEESTGSRLGLFLSHRFFASEMVTSQTSIRRSAFAHCGRDMTLLACALERHRLARGSIPGRLEDLAPDFTDRIPLDVFTGEPPHYRPTGSGGYVLYSVGWNEKDDGGEPGKEWFSSKDGDWVWRIAKE
jgi:hypothetical protein